MHHECGGVLPRLKARVNELTSMGWVAHHIGLIGAGPPTAPPRPPPQLPSDSLPPGHMLCVMGAPLAPPPPPPLPLPLDYPLSG